MKSSLLVIFVALCVHTKVQVSGSRLLTDEELSDLTEQYGLMQAPFGDFLFSPIFQSTSNIDLTSGPAPLGASYLILFNGACEGWLVFAESDRVYTWISGQATIDLANADGEINSVCLGDSLADPACVYTLVIPAGWKADIRPSGHLIYTGTVIGGSVANGVAVSFDSMREQYSGNTDLIDEVQAQCS